MSEECGRCGAATDSEAVTCGACGALLAAYQPPAGAREAMPEPVFDVPEAPTDVPVRSAPTGPSMEPDPVSEMSPATAGRTPGPERSPERRSGHLDRASKSLHDEAPAAAGAPVPVRREREPELIGVEPAPAGARPARPVRRSPVPSPPLTVSPPRPDGEAAGSSRLFLVGSIVCILAACILLVAGSSDGVSDAYAYVGLCLGPLGLIGLLSAVGLAILRRANDRR